MLACIDVAMTDNLANTVYEQNVIKRVGDEHFVPCVLALEVMCKDIAAGRVDEERCLALVERVQFFVRAALPSCGDCLNGLERTAVSIAALTRQSTSLKSKCPRAWSTIRYATAICDAMKPRTH